ncbi:hypothetical protein DL1_03310 [Thioclava dalianensis]|uniref:IraD/Gp25-like domain-containing protein n=1 Tax=Thioclava dalianensis TaxID=1185766 RepID=A0A074TCW7_9RHOB|nr:GPW/gp25 family protein [Thioclava dalianensis]KEP69631.1 hypothetical protein DL1_03310 [Thioclava dalianensis]SFN16210.1 hypothetical protein SAMN05216224_102724 [Thioclava dalianensis]
MDLNHDTGDAVAGWEEVVQSLLTVLATRVSTRVFRREFGSNVPALIDAPMNEANVLALYVAIAEALERWEPRFELSDVQVQGAAGGAILMTLTGTYRPKAHIGDLSTVADRLQTVRVLRDRVENWSLSA